MVANNIEFESRFKGASQDAAPKSRILMPKKRVYLLKKLIVYFACILYAVEANIKRLLWRFCRVFLRKIIQ